MEKLYFRTLSQLFPEIVKFLFVIVLISITSTPREVPRTLIITTPIPQSAQYTIPDDLPDREYPKFANVRNFAVTSVSGTTSTSSVISGRAGEDSFIHNYDA